MITSERTGARWPAKRRWRWAVTSAALLALAGIGVWFMVPRPAEAVAVTEPTSGQLDAFTETSVLFGHQSVGMNILDGVENVYRDAGREPPQIVEASDSPGGAAMVHAYVGANGDPLGKFADFRDLVDGPAGDAAAIALVKLCYTDITASTDAEAVFAEYTELMADLERRHPDIAFVYATVPLTTDRSWRANLKALFGSDDQMGPADNQARERYNTLIREEYAASGRLFDIAAVEATMETDPAVRTGDEAEYHVLNTALSSDAGHLNDVGGRIAAAELIRIVADLRS